MRSQDHLFLQSLKFALWDVIGASLFFPIWWYTQGFMQFLKERWSSFVRREKEISFFLWLSTLFKPMYGQTDLTGKLISFAFRLIVLVWKSLWFLLAALKQLLFVLLWLGIPVVAIYQLMKLL